MRRHVTHSGVNDASAVGIEEDFLAIGASKDVDNLPDTIVNDSGASEGVVATPKVPLRSTQTDTVSREGDRNGHKGHIAFDGCDEIAKPITTITTGDRSVASEKKADAIEDGSASIFEDSKASENTSPTLFEVAVITQVLYGGIKDQTEGPRDHITISCLASWATDERRLASQNAAAAIAEAASSIKDLRVGTKAQTKARESHVILFRCDLAATPTTTVTTNKGCAGTELPIPNLNAAATSARIRAKIAAARARKPTTTALEKSVLHLVVEERSVLGNESTEDEDLQGFRGICARSVHTGLELGERPHHHQRAVHG